LINRQAKQQVFSSSLEGESVVTCRLYWQMFQVYMLIIILILPTIIMTFAYTSISIKAGAGSTMTIMATWPPLPPWPP
jgi:hypothetical protein